ncbi:MAG: 4Fe-4S binding protein [Muribaculaceae bacterium]|nr:4Fe-4S binding protein [Muribaculaceae bacterium]
MLRKVRIILALIFFIGAALLFLDFTGTVHAYLGWIAKVQFLPAVLAVNIGVVALLVGLTLLFGRVYCSVICPLGVMQDIFAKFGKWSKKNRYSYSPALNIWRYTLLGVMIVAIILGIGSVVGVLAPYSSFGRIVHSLGAPLWQWGNNILADYAEKRESYAFYSTEIWMRSIAVFATAVITLIVLAILAWRNGRTYCNSICPVGTTLGFLSRFSLFRPTIELSKCNSCGLCARNCKSACIDSKAHKIDYSRCVSCMDCIGKCHKEAIKFTYKREKALETIPAVEPIKNEVNDSSRRNFLGLMAFIGGSALIEAAEKTVDGGLAVIEDKKIPDRKTHISPPGSKSHINIASRCTGCQLCVSVCPNHVLRPSGNLENFMHPVASFERGYCRPECTRCSEVCPTGAIQKIDLAEKSSIQIGRAQWVKENCVPLTDGVSCGNCERHCPVGAIQMIATVPGNEESLKIPAVDTEKCIGCGACENLCPSRPFSAIYVEGNERHRIV